MNKDERDHRFIVAVSGSGNLKLDPERAEFTVRSGEVFNAAVRVRRDAWEIPGINTIRFSIEARDRPDLKASTEARFFAPTRQALCKIRRPIGHEC